MIKLTTEAKLSAVQQYLEGVGTYPSIRASIGTSENIVRTLVMQYEHHGEDAFKKSYTS